MDISHEALIRQWDRLKQWVEDEAASRRAMDQLERDAEDWSRRSDQGDDYRCRRHSRQRGPDELPATHVLE